jgi:hypothetical protein
MDSIIITSILLLLLAMIAFAVWVLRDYIIKGNVPIEATDDTERLEIIISAVLDRSLDFDVQRQTVREYALQYREVLSIRKRRLGDNNVIPFSDRHLSQDKIRKI